MYLLDLPNTMAISTSRSISSRPKGMMMSSPSRGDLVSGFTTGQVTGVTSPLTLPARFTIDVEAQSLDIGIRYGF